MANWKDKKSLLVILVLLITLNTVFIFNMMWKVGNVSNTNQTTTNSVIKDPIRSSEGGANKTLIVATGAGPVTIDPQNVWDSASYNVLDNCLEGLYAYNLSDPNLSIIPRLASDFGTWFGNNYTVPLRQDVTFQDGAKFTATDVVWTFNRLGNLMRLNKAEAAGLYTVYDPAYGKVINIIKKVVEINTYTVRFVLNTTYGPLLPLLCFEGSMIIKAGSAPFSDNIDLTSGTVVGTGPWIYKSYQPDVQVTFNAFKNYYRGAPYFDQLIFDVIPNSDARNTAMLSGDTDILLTPRTSMLNTYNTTPNLVLKHVGSNFDTSYLGMNCQKIPRLVRKAISYAFDYNYTLQNVLSGFGYRMKSPIPKGVEFWNYSFNVATFNVTKARYAMQEAYTADNNVFGGITPPSDVTNDSAWESANLLTYNYTYNADNPVRANIYDVLRDNLAEIGITVTDAGTTWANFVFSLYGMAGFTRNDLRLYWIGWIPDYNDGSDYINPLFTNRSVASNGAQFNNATVQKWMEQATLEPNPSIRQQLYNKIQKSLVEWNYPWVFGFTGDNYDVWKVGVHGFPSNAMDKAYFYPCYFEKGDNIPPTWDQIPQDQVLNLGESLRYNVNASDNIEIYQYWINDTHNFNIDKDGLITNTNLLTLKSYDITIRAYDENMNYCEANITITIQDNVKPIITIITPENGDNFGNNPPNFNITVKELSLNSTWYTLDNGKTNFTFSENIGSIKQTYWDNLSDGNYTLRFYAQDTFGNIGSSKVWILKETGNNTSKGIPGYNLLVFIGTIATVITLSTALGVSGLSLTFIIIIAVSGTMGHLYANRSSKRNDI
ncbi:MAG: ABC transporter substrate-binding protein [Candidatus Lokiarchaeota archaeon]